jgi:histidinol-phosphate aminotransferase
MSKFLRASLGANFGYTPGEQPSDSGGWLKLNSNESPLPPSPSVAAAVAGAAADLARYPSPVAEPLRSVLAAIHDVEPEQVFVGNGADQVLDCCFRAYASPGDAVVRTEPGYSLLPVLAALFSVRDDAVALEADGALPADFASRPAVLRFVVNPNSPTGHWTPPGTLEIWLREASGVVVIDEAYCDFAPASCVPRLAAHPTWLVVRTLSKSHALAGLRVGYALGDATLIADLNAVRDSYPVDRCAIAGAIAALEDRAHHRLIVDTVIRERARMSARLRALGWTVAASHANFVFASPPRGLSAEAVAARLRQSRILVRHFTLPGLDEALRITVGDSPATDRILEEMSGLTGSALSGT